MADSIRKLIDTTDYTGLEAALSNNPKLADEGIPYDDANTARAHPLHRICDGVFSGKYSDEAAVKMAKIFLEHGAKVDGDNLIEQQDTPLIAAASLNADEVANLYVSSGANIHHAGCHGGTALHWAAWCGRDKLVRRLVKEGADIDKKCVDFKATPLFWAVHGLKKNTHNTLEPVRILIQAGADKSIPNGEGLTVLDLLDDGDLELKALLI